MATTDPPQSDTTHTNTDTTTLPPPDTLVHPVDTNSYTVDNRWACDIDGIHYSGAVDTTFIQLSHIYETNADTMITCTGTSDDKRANIHFRMTINRSAVYEGNVTNFEGSVIFDTLSNNYLTSVYSNSHERIRFQLDTLVSNKLKAAFSSSLSNSFINSIDYNPAVGFPHTVSNGRFSCTFGKGDNEPKFFSFFSEEGNVAGVFRNARLTSNSLILDG